MYTITMQDSLSHRSRIIAAAILYALAIGLFFSPMTRSLELFDRQLIIAPIVVLLLIIIMLPRIGIGALMVSSILIFVHQSNYSIAPGKEILLARFEHDPLLKRTTSWKNVLSLRNAFNVRILGSTVSDAHQAARIASSNETLVVWSNHRRIMLTPPPSPTSASDAPLQRLTGVKLITGIPAIPLLDVFKPEGSAFVKNLTHALALYNRGSFEGEGALLKLASARGRWSSRVHLAFPLFVIGTSNLRTALAHDAPRMDDILCAIKILKRADKVLAQSRAPTALSVAVLNNLAVANVLAYRLSDSKRFYTTARSALTTARSKNKLISHSAPDQVTSIPFENSIALSPNYESARSSQSRRSKHNDQALR